MPPSSDFSPKLPPQIPNSLYANPLWIFKGQLPPKGNPWPSSPNQLHPWSSRIISSWSLHLSSFGSTLWSHPWFSLSLTKNSQASEQVLSVPSSVCVQNLATFPHLRGYRVVPPTRAGEVVSLLPSLPCFSLFSIWQPESHLQNINSDYPFLYSKHGNFSCKMDSCSRFALLLPFWPRFLLSSFLAYSIPASLLFWEVNSFCLEHSFPR